VSFQIVFAAANGPLAWSILAFNQALVFHKWQNVTSVFIHISPMMLTYGLRWHPGHSFNVCRWAGVRGLVVAGIRIVDAHPRMKGYPKQAME
jgi:hypothetical protein